MLNPRLATRYAKSIIGLANEKDQLEIIYKDMLYLQRLCKISREFVNLLRSPVINPFKKKAIVQAVTKQHTSELTNSFILLLISKGRESNLPEIITAFIEQYKKQKDIHTVKLTTAIAASDELKKVMVNKVKEQTLKQNIELVTDVQEDIIGGFLLEIGGTLVDASIIYDLNKIKSQFLNNDFIYKIR